MRTRVLRRLDRSAATDDRPMLVLVASGAALAVGLALLVLEPILT